MLNLTLSADQEELEEQLIRFLLRSNQKELKLWLLDGLWKQQEKERISQWPKNYMQKF